MLGLIGEGTGIAAKVLKSMGINLKEARIEVEKIIGRGSGGRAPPTSFLRAASMGARSALRNLPADLGCPPLRQLPQLAVTRYFFGVGPHFFSLPFAPCPRI